MKSGVPVCKPQESSDSLDSETPRSASAHDLDEVSPPPLDWAKMLETLRQRKKESACSSVQSAMEAAPEAASKAVDADKTVQARPLATPARALPKQRAAENKWLLPNYVVQQLQKKEEYVPPFDTQGADDGEDTAAIDTELAESPKKKSQRKEKKNRSVENQAKTKRPLQQRMKQL